MVVMTTTVTVEAHPAAPAMSVVVVIEDQDGTKHEHVLAPGANHRFYVSGGQKLLVAESNAMIVYSAAAVIPNTIVQHARAEAEILPPAQLVPGEDPF